MSLARCDNSDADALRFVIDLGFTLPARIYKPTRINLKDQFVTDKLLETRPDCWRVAVNGCKHHVVCVTRDVLLVWDGTHFVVPSPAVEKEIPASALYGIFTDPGEVGGGGVLGKPYRERLDHLRRKFSEVNNRWDVATIESDDYSNSCLQIPNHIGRRNAVTVRYVYVKPGQTVAAVGLDRQNVLLAYRRPDGDLEYKTKTANNGSASAFLLNEPVRRLTAADGAAAFLTIKDGRGGGGGGGRHALKLYDLPITTNDDGVTTTLLFKHYAAVEFRENSKLGAHVFDGGVSDVSEFKLPLYKDGNGSKGGGTSQEKLIEKALQDSKNFPMIMKLLQTLPDNKKEEVCRSLKSSDKITDLQLNYKPIRQ
ncbi:hypothetical protein AGLY_017567 [Aphis glycines]|uniref:Uncharacterized protein n=1 Tax=Aphis glycines TaxID=307491 RepID=A0A6G0SWL0_APHGL|nr:hypothetical protein AGLY_017567 [Aphis glycines]